MTLPADLYEMPTLAQALAAAGHPEAEVYGCPTCSRRGPASGFVCTAELPGNQPAYVCHTCASGPFREAHAAAAAKAAAALEGWSTEAGGAIKRERDRRVNETLWTTSEGSPLTANCREEWAAWRSAMFRLTLDFPDPGAVTWPVQPALAYE